MKNDVKLILGFVGKKPNDPGVQEIKSHISQGRAQGVLLFGYNIVGPGQAKALIDHLKDGAPDLLVAVDQEGGLVQRLSPKNGFTAYPEAHKIAQKPLEEAHKIYDQMAQELSNLGINYNFGPCVDVHEEGCPIIGQLGRSYGDAAAISQYATAFIEAHEKQGVKTCLKHFPGHGRAKGDSHEGFVDATDHWREDELAVFENLLKKTKVAGVMTAHIFHKDWEENGNMGLATFSRPLLTGVLREKYGFEGDIIADDFCMGAIQAHYTPQEAVKKARAAGVNTFIYSGNQKATGGHGLKGFVNIAEKFWQYI